MGLRKRPLAFTEQGIAMLSGLLRSPQAITVNIEIMRAFVRLRRLFISQQKTDKELAEVKSFVLKHSRKTDQEFHRVWKVIEQLSTPTQEQHRIGFDLS